MKDGNMPKDELISEAFKDVFAEVYSLEDKLNEIVDLLKTEYVSVSFDEWLDGKYTIVFNPNRTISIYRRVKQGQEGWNEMRLDGKLLEIFCDEMKRRKWDWHK